MIGRFAYNTTEEFIQRGSASTEFQTWLYTAMGVLAAILASVGVYGVVSYAVAQRMREIGVRIALGSSKRRVLGLMMRQGFFPVAIGLAVGVVCALGLTGLARATLPLYEVQPDDPVIYALAISLLLFIGTIASYMPARRATRVDPITILRHD